jgi:hypothetical protein
MRALWCVAFCLLASTAHASWEQVRGQERDAILRALTESLNAKKGRVGSCEINRRVLTNTANGQNMAINTRLLYRDTSGTNLLLTSHGFDEIVFHGTEISRTFFSLDRAATDIVNVRGELWVAFRKNLGSISKPKWTVELKPVRQVLCD